MTYYKVLEKYDQYRYGSKSNHFYVANELYTNKQIDRLGLNRKFMEKVEAKKSNIFWFFGCRFETN